MADVQNGGRHPVLRPETAPAHLVRSTCRGTLGNGLFGADRNGAAKLHFARDVRFGESFRCVEKAVWRWRQIPTLQSDKFAAAVRERWPLGWAVSQRRDGEGGTRGSEEMSPGKACSHQGGTPSVMCTGNNLAQSAGVNLRVCRQSDSTVSTVRLDGIMHRPVRASRPPR